MYMIPLTKMTLDAPFLPPTDIYIRNSVKIMDI